MHCSGLTGARPSGPASLDSNSAGWRGATLAPLGQRLCSSFCRLALSLLGSRGPWQWAPITSASGAMSSSVFGLGVQSLARVAVFGRLALAPLGVLTCWREA